MKQRSLAPRAPTKIVFVLACISFFSAGQSVFAQNEASGSQPAQQQEKLKQIPKDLQDKLSNEDLKKAEEKLHPGEYDPEKQKVVLQELPGESTPANTEPQLPGKRTFTGTQEGKELSKATQEKIQGKLEEEGAGKIVIFDEDGKVLSSKSVNEHQFQKYDSFAEFLKSKDSPVTCEPPITPTPPPGCVICKGGKEACSTSPPKKKGTAIELIPEAAEQPKAKTPENEKPQ